MRKSRAQRRSDVRAKLAEMKKELKLFYLNEATAFKVQLTFAGIEETLIQEDGVVWRIANGTYLPFEDQVVLERWAGMIMEVIRKNYKTDPLAQLSFFEKPRFKRSGVYAEAERSEADLAQLRTTRLYQEVLQNEDGHFAFEMLTGQEMQMRLYGRRVCYIRAGYNRVERANKLGNYAVGDYAFMTALALMCILAVWNAYPNVKKRKLNKNTAYFQKESTLQYSLFK